MSLVDLARATEGIAMPLAHFIDKVATRSADIASVVSELYAISSALRTLDTLKLSPLFDLIDGDLEMVARASLRHTIGDFMDLFQRMNAAGPVDYDQTEKSDQAMMATIRKALAPLRVAQDKRYAETMDKRKRQQQQQQQQHQQQQQQQQHTHPLFPLHPHFQHQQQPQPQPQPQQQHQQPPPPPPQPPKPPSASRPRTPDARRHSRHARKAAEMTQRGSWERERPSPSAPPPISPSFSEGSPISSHPSPVSVNAETASSLSSSSYNFVNGVRHWSVKLFGMQMKSSTPLTITGDISFPGKPQLSMIFYIRDRDHRTRVLCRVRTSKTRTVYSTTPITSLQIYRNGSCLQLCRKDPEDEDDLIMWANLQFSSIEKMVLFFCTFLALRGQDSSHPVTKITDHELRGELQLFGGDIQDDNFLHTLQILKDHESKSVRLQASVSDGELERVPIWSAFIHPYFRKKGWIQKVGPKVVYISEMQRMTFIDSEEYTPQISSRGDHVLTFLSERETDGFMRVIEGLIKHSRPR
ncbi:predicted protein [Uncinocarpus reesii 1704]|uniref:Uncharacterized protein n=1 Tax=Uncinocarpus reesii (strain UAMH 1704) TaxID=336963 RepID=C4JZ27_UNCRE|nr:uncharacterized protein UREG_07428 [Uncinocarpus reesii 1704]EEP82563.1 predicted protein [Uncinocarpus reesii 1704]